MGKKTWREIYKERTEDCVKALSRVRSGSRVFISAGCGRPQKLIDELMRQADKLDDIEIIHLMTLGIAPYVENDYKKSFRHNALFIGDNVSEAVSSGMADYTPISKYQITKQLRSGRISLDAAFVTVSPPNEMGFVSMGITVGVSKSAATCARYVIAEVNPNMPRTLGDTFIHVSEIDSFVISDLPLVEAPTIPTTPEWDNIARNCAKLIEDGATVQLGYNPISFALTKYLQERQDLGLLTDVLTAPSVELIKNGVINNANKSMHPHKTIVSLCYGTKETYDFVADNPQIEFHPCDYVNNPFFISQHDRMIAINEASKVDLSGMVCAKSTGPSFGSGFMLGATHAKRGKSIICLPSTSAGGKESNIVMHVDPGSGIGISLNRDDVQFVVTEYGVASLHGRTVRERALALIHVAHPKFREELLNLAKEHYYVYQDQILPPEAVYPNHLEHWHELKDGTKVFVRPSVPEDERMVQSFVYSLCENSIHYRFHGKPQKMDHSNVQHFVSVDYEESLTLLAILKGENNEEENVIGMAQFLLYPGQKRAEVAFISADKYQKLGIGTQLLKDLVGVGREKGVEKLFAEVLSQNKGMLDVFHKSELPIELVLDEGVYDISLDITAT